MQKIVTNLWFDGRVERVTKAMLEMKKLDIAELERTTNYG